MRRLLKKMAKKKKKYDLTCGFTHAGRFHADEVFGTALLRIINPDINIIRGDTVPEDFAGIVYDIGMGEFDHHQVDKEVRDNGIAYSAFGLLWKRFWSKIDGLTHKMAMSIDKKLVQPIDYSDNTGNKNPLSCAVEVFNPTWYSDSDGTEEFERAVDFAIGILSREIHYQLDYPLAEEMVKKEMEASRDKTVLVLKRFMPYRSALKDSNFKFVIYPDQRSDGYMIAAVLNSDGKPLVPFPKEWGGKSREELPKGVLFCHTGLHIATTDTLQGAIRIAKKVAGK